MSDGFWKTYKRHFLLAELIISIIFTIGIMVLVHFLWSHELLKSWIITNRNTIYPLIATIGGTLLGFVITGVSIILAFSESEKLRLLKRSKQYKTIFTIYFSTIKYLAITTIIAIIGLVVNDDFSVVIFYLLLWSVTISALRIWRCLWVLQSIVEIIHNINCFNPQNPDKIHFRF